jgi:hypothetical protein
MFTTRGLTLITLFSLTVTLSFAQIIFNPVPLPTVINWYNVNGTIPWTGRFDAQCAEYNTPGFTNRKTIYMQGGSANNGAGATNDFWLSRDGGLNWDQQQGSNVAKLQAPLRGGGTLSVTFAKTLILVGGYSTVSDITTATNTVYWSPDEGKNWHEIDQTYIPFAPRRYHAAVTIPNSNIVVITGGAKKDGVNTLGDTWVSFDGKGQNWIQQGANQAVSWTPRQLHNMAVVGDIVFGATIVLAAGLTTGDVYLNDVWTSVNLGSTWTLINPAAGFAPRFGANMVAQENILYVFNGGVEEGNLPTDDNSNPILPPNSVNSQPDAYFALFTDTWVSVDNGVTWTEQPPNFGLQPRLQACAGLVQDKELVTWTGTQEELVGFQEPQIAFLNNIITSKKGNGNGNGNN